MDYYVGEIRLLAFSKYAPENFLPCDGRELQVTEYELLHAVIGTTYGGRGEATFCVPDLRGRSPVHVGTAKGAAPLALGQSVGSEAVKLSVANLPSHTHAVSVSKRKATSIMPGAQTVQGDVSPNYLYCAVSQAGTVQALAPESVSPSPGNGEAHSNIQPSLGLQYVICVNGLYPDF